MPDASPTQVPDIVGPKAPDGLLVHHRPDAARRRELHALVQRLTLNSPPYNPAPDPESVELHSAGR